MLTFIRKYHPSPRVRVITALFLPLGEAGEDTTGLSVSGFMALPRDLRWIVICEIATDPCYAFKPGSRHLDEQLLPLPCSQRQGKLELGVACRPHGTASHVMKIRTTSQDILEARI